MINVIKQQIKENLNRVINELKLFKKEFFKGIEIRFYIFLAEHSKNIQRKKHFEKIVTKKLDEIDYVL